MLRIDFLAFFALQVFVGLIWIGAEVHTERVLKPPPNLKWFQGAAVCPVGAIGTCKFSQQGYYYLLNAISGYEKGNK